MNGFDTKFREEKQIIRHPQQDATLGNFSEEEKRYQRSRAEEEVRYQRSQDEEEKRYQRSRAEEEVRYKRAQDEEDRRYKRSQAEEEKRHQRLQDEEDRRHKREMVEQESKRRHELERDSLRYKQVDAENDRHDFLSALAYNRNRNNLANDREYQHEEWSREEQTGRRQHHERKDILGMNQSHALAIASLQQKIPDDNRLDYTNSLEK